MNNGNFEKEIASLCDDLLALRAEIWRLNDHKWSSSTGAGYETVWNTPPSTPGFIPIGAGSKQSEMNNAISGLDSVRVAIDAASAALAVLAEFRPLT